MTNTTAANNSDDAEQKVDDTRPAAPLGVAVATTAPVVNNQPYNPYLRRRPISIAAMGIQSQLRGGSVKACLKRGTKRKAQSYKQSAVPGGSIFHLHPVETLHNLQSQTTNSVGTNLSVPHRGHHKRCPLNTKTRGGSATSVMIKRMSDLNLMLNRAPQASALGRRLLDANTPTVGTPM